MEINKINYPPKIKRQNMSKRPWKQRWYIQVLTFIIGACMRAGKKRKLVKDKSMEGLKKTPYLLLINHMQFFDFAMMIKATQPRKVNNVVSIDAFDLKRFALYLGGCWPKRKFINETYTVRSVLHCLHKYKSISAMYPEARYTLTGTTASLPESLGKMIKLAKVPVVTLIFNGHHLLRPTWGDQKTRKEVPVLANMKQILTAEQVQQLSVEEINVAVNKAFVYDEYKYWRKTGFKIKYWNRAWGIHTILYKCPNCSAEGETTSKGAEIACKKCKSVWELAEDGLLNCKTGETKFKHVPDWVEWERSEVRKEIEAGTYEIKDNTDAFGMPHSKYMIPLGKTNWTHNLDGFKMTGHYNGEDFAIVRQPLENYCIQVEFTFPRLKGLHTAGISTENDTIFFVPREGLLQKLYFGVEELYKFKKAGEGSKK